MALIPPTNPINISISINRSISSSSFTNLDNPAPTPIAKRYVPMMVEN